MVLMATIMPVAILFCGFVIDMANWFQHDRHLQTQADAAALAGALNFMSCPDNTPIRDKVDEYSGGQWNTQVGGTQGNVHMLLNSKTYYNQSDKTDGTVVEGEPCTANMVDVKVTETDLPWWFAVGSVDFLNAHARVELHTIDTLSGAVPLGVPDVKPVKARVTWVDEDKAPGDAEPRARNRRAETHHLHGRNGALADRGSHHREGGPPEHGRARGPQWGRLHDLRRSARRVLRRGL